MRNKELETINKLVETEIEMTEDLIRTTANDNNDQELIDHAKRLADALQVKWALSDYTYCDNSDDHMISQTKRLQSLLNHCCVDPGADIYITVKHSDGRQAGVKLYDHAALVQELHNALDYFLSEL